MWLGRFGKGRLAGISDGVFSIAMTLLILDLKFPEPDGAISHKEFVSLVWKITPNIIAWLFSFGLLARLWMMHHKLVAGVPQYSQKAVLLNFVFLGVVSFIPFPTSMISSYPEQPLAVIMLVATYVLGPILLWAMWREIRKEDMPTEVRAQKDRATRWLLIWFPTAGAAACALALVDTRISMVPWVVILAIGVILGRPQK